MRAAAGETTSLTECQPVTRGDEYGLTAVSVKYIIPSIILYRRARSGHRMERHRGARAGSMPLAGALRATQGDPRMSTIAVLVGILGALLVGVISPGPSFVLVCRTSIAVSRRDGLAAALGMRLGAAIFGTLALLGLSALLAQVEWLYAGLKLLGGACLVHLGVRIWRGASAPLVIPGIAAFQPNTLARSFSFGLATQLSNPKTAVVYASVFAALLPAALPPWILVVLPPLIFLLEASWYAAVALAFSAERPRSAYVDAKGWIDRAAGAVMGALGLALIVETVKPR